MEDMIRAKRKNLTVILALVSLFYFILTILLPVTYVRRFSVLSPFPDKHIRYWSIPENRRFLMYMISWREEAGVPQPEQDSVYWG